MIGSGIGGRKNSIANPSSAFERSRGWRGSRFARHFRQAGRAACTAACWLCILPAGIGRREVALIHYRILFSMPRVNQTPVARAVLIGRSTQSLRDRVMRTGKTSKVSAAVMVNRMMLSTSARRDYKLRDVVRYEMRRGNGLHSKIRNPDENRNPKSEGRNALPHVSISKPAIGTRIVMQTCATAAGDLLLASAIRLVCRHRQTQCHRCHYRRPGLR